MGRTPASQKSIPNSHTEASGKLAAVNLAMEQIEKQYGRGSIMRFGEVGQKFDISVISTGCLPLDLALGVGGVPRGRIIEIFGPEASGKTTICLSIIAQAQKHGALQPLLTQSMPLIPYGHKNLELSLTIY